MVGLGAGMALTSTSPRWRFKPSSSMLDPPATTSPQSFGWMDGRSTQISPRLTLTHSLTLGRATTAQRSAAFPAVLSYRLPHPCSSVLLERSRHPTARRQPHLGRGIAEHVAEPPAFNTSNQPPKPLLSAISSKHTHTHTIPSHWPPPPP